MVVTNVLLQPAINIACTALDQFVKSAKSNVDHTFTIALPKMGKFKGLSINIRIRKTRSTVSFKIAGLPEQKFKIPDLKDACIIIINAAIAAA